MGRCHRDLPVLCGRGAHRRICYCGTTRQGAHHPGKLRNSVYYLYSFLIVHQVRLFKIRNVSLAFCIVFFFGICMLGAIIYLPLYFQIVQGDSATTSGLRLLPLMLSLVIFSMASGITISKTGQTVPIAIAGCAVLTLGMGILSLLDRNSSFGQMVGCLIPIGVGLGLNMQVTYLASVGVTLVLHIPDTDAHHTGLSAPQRDRCRHVGHQFLS